MIESKLLLTCFFCISRIVVQNRSASFSERISSGGGNSWVWSKLGIHRIWLIFFSSKYWNIFEYFRECGFGSKITSDSTTWLLIWLYWLTSILSLGLISKIWIQFTWVNEQNNILMCSVIESIQIINSYTKFKSIKSTLRFNLNWSSQSSNKFTLKAPLLHLCVCLR